MSANRKPSPDAAAVLARAEESSEKMRSLLARVVREENVTLRDLGRRTGRSEDYWSKLLRGLRKLHTEHVYQALDVVGVAPEVFFSRLHARPLLTESAVSNLDPQQAAKLLAGEAAKVLLHFAALTGGRVGEE